MGSVCFIVVIGANNDNKADLTPAPRSLQISFVVFSGNLLYKWGYKTIGYGK